MFTGGAGPPPGCGLRSRPWQTTSWPCGSIVGGGATEACSWLVARSGGDFTRKDRDGIRFFISEPFNDFSNRRTRIDWCLSFFHLLTADIRRLLLAHVA